MPAAPFVTYPPNAPRPNAWANPNPMTATFIHPVTAFIEKTFVITEFELRKLRHDFTELITRALQPNDTKIRIHELFVERLGASCMR
jgi:hypothetical protein